MLLEQKMDNFIHRAESLENMTFASYFEKEFLKSLFSEIAFPPVSYKHGFACLEGTIS